MCFPYFSAGAALILHAFFAAPAFAASTNITVDDTDSTVWTFVGTWSAVTPATPCPGCFAQPDPKLVYNSTWHDGTLVSGSCTFQGSAIYIYGIDMTATSGTNISFSMNNPPTAGFHYFGDTGTTYNVPFFSATNLDSSVEHTVTFIGETTLAGAGAMLFDYAVITVNQEDTTSASPASTSPLLPPSIAPLLPPSIAPLSPASSTTPLLPASISPLSPASSTTPRSPASIAPLSPASIAPLSPSSTAPLSNSRASPSPSSSPSLTPTHTTHMSKTGPIVGGTVGVVGVLAILIALLLFLRRRRASTVQSSTVEPYQQVPANEPHEASFLKEAVPSTGVSTVSIPPPTTTATSTAQSQSPPAPVILALDPNPTRARDSEVEARLRHLEALAQPPQYQ